MKLYTVTIRGIKYYFSGNLPSEAISASEDFCLKLEMDGKVVDTSALFDRLINYIVSELELPAAPVNIEHIFRINF